MFKKLKKTMEYRVVLGWMPLLIGALLLGCKTVQPIDTELTKLQGTWKSMDESEPVSVTIKGNHLHLYRDSDFWFETTIALNTEVDPHQFRATIQRSADSQGDSQGKSVPAIFKIQGETLTMLAFSDEQESPPETFDGSAGMVYELKKSTANELSIIEGPF